MHKNLIGHIACIFTIFIWGTTFISTKVLLKDFSPIEVLFIRFILGYLVLWLIYPHKLYPSNRKQELYFMGAGLCGTTLYFLFENIALTYTLASTVGIIVSISPFFTAIFSFLFLKEKRPSYCFFIGFILAMTGICLISLHKTSSLEVSFIGTLFAILAAVTWASYSVIWRKISSFGYPIIAATRRNFFYGLLFILPFTIPMRFNVSPAKLVMPVNLFNFLFLGIGASAVCFLTWNYAVKLLGVVKTSVYIYLVPVITTITSVIILQERITIQTLGGIGLILAGLFLSESGKEMS